MSKYRPHGTLEELNAKIATTEASRDVLRYKRKIKSLKTQDSKYRYPTPEEKKLSQQLENLKSVRRHRLAKDKVRMEKARLLAERVRAMGVTLSDDEEVDVKEPPSSEPTGLREIPEIPEEPPEVKIIPPKPPPKPFPEKRIIRRNEDDSSSESSEQPSNPRRPFPTPEGPPKRKAKPPIKKDPSSLKSPRPKR